MEEEEQKEKIKFDIYNNEEEGEPTDYKKKTVLDNVSIFSILLTCIQEDTMEKPVMLKTNKTAKKYDFFDEDD